MALLSSPSKLVALAAGVKPVGQPAMTDGICAMCGTVHKVGDLVTPFAPKDSFMDFALLRAPTSTQACGWCIAIWNGEFTQAFSRTVICAEGVFPAASNNDIAWWLTNPPTGDWVFVRPDQKVQHLMWRAPINRSTELFRILSGENVMTIRRESLIKGVAAARNLAQHASRLSSEQEPGKKAGKSKTFKSPFIQLSRDFDGLSQGTMRHELLVAARTDAEIARDVATINALTPGELWGLTALLFIEAPQKPSACALPDGSRIKASKEKASKEAKVSTEVGQEP